VAYSFDSKWDVSSLDELQRRLSRVPAEAAKQVSKRNRQHAAQLVKRIKVEMPVAGGTVKHRHSWSHETGLSRRGPGGSGKLRRSIRTRVSSDYANVLGGNAATPYFIVNEFGGGAKFVNGKGNKVFIPVRERSPSVKSLGLFDRSGTQRGAAGWFFWPTAEHYAPAIRTAIVRDAEAIVRRELAGRLGT
jgi:phage gpG-like protein